MLLVGLRAGLHSQDLAFIDHELPVVADRDLQPIERPRRRPFEVEPRLVEAATVARAFELVLRREPAWRASEVRALGENRVDALFLAHDPDALLLLVLLADLPDGVVGSKTGLKSGRRLEQNPWKGGADKAEQAEGAEDAEAAPAQTSEEIPPRPDPSFDFSFLYVVRHSRFNA